MTLTDGEPVIVSKIENIISEIEKVTKNRGLINHIANSIKKNSGNDVISRPGSRYCFKNREGSCVDIDIDAGNICVDIQFPNYSEKINCRKNHEGMKIEFFGNYCIPSVKNTTLLTNRTEEVYYDRNNNFLMSDSFIQSTTCRNREIIKNILYSNYDKYIKQCVSDGKLIKREETRYHYQKDFDNIRYYECDYSDGIYCSVDEDVNILPKYSVVLDGVEKYESKIHSIEKKISKKQKTLLK